MKTHKLKLNRINNLICIMLDICFYPDLFQTYNEDTNHRLQTDRQSVLLLRSVIEAYSVGDGKKRSGNDWKFFVLAGSVLSDITMNNINRGKKGFSK